ncbi:hypothetical protein GCM10022407_13190 [Hymenobacter antarcticus]|uniref:Integrase catalytic domain-containing protein n=1 Tax=Hymenobacter antarcticus TaxID=486270 RepID=A0ABP7PQI5_9BACT
MRPSVPKPCAWPSKAARPKPPHGRSTSPPKRSCAPNQPLDQPKPTQANRVWVSDITYLPLANGYWAYLGAFQDGRTKHVVGWHVGATMPKSSSQPPCSGRCSPKSLSEKAVMPSAAEASRVQQQSAATSTKRARCLGCARYDGLFG